MSVFCYRPCLFLTQMQSMRGAVANPSSRAVGNTSMTLQHFHDPAARGPSVVQDACSYGLALLGEERGPPESSYTSWGSLLG